MSRELKLNARWVWPLKHYTIPWNQYALFRRVFALRSRPRKAIAHVSADARYTLYVNGKYVHFGPARSFPDRYCVDAIDIAPLLVEGPNTICAIAHQYGVPTFQTTFRDVAGFLFDCKTEPDGQTLHTPTDWLCKFSKAWRRDVARMSIQTGFQEHYDGAIDAADWMSPNFAATEETGWHSPKDLGPANVHPWLRLEARAVPLLANEPSKFAKIVGVFRGENLRAYKVADDICKLCEAEQPRTIDADRETAGTILEAMAMFSDDDSVARVIPPAENPSHEFVAALLDLDAYRTGHFVLDIVGAAGGEIIDVVYSEFLDPKGKWIGFSTGVGGGAPCATRYRCRPGDQRWETFHFVGMRYVAIVFRNLTRPLNVRYVGVRRVFADVPMIGSFECDDKQLNRIWNLCRETQLACLLDAFVDCPWREQAMWWGDARVQAAVTAHAFGDASILEHGIRLMSHSQAGDGSLHSHPPSDIPSHRLPDFMLTWVGTLWDHYWLTGRTDLIRDCAAALHRVFDFFATHENDEGLIGGFDGWWVFLDWADLQKGDFSAVLNLQYLQALRAARDLCATIGDEIGTARYFTTSAKVQAAIVAKFWDEPAGTFHDSVHSQHANALAILLDLKGEHHDKLAREVLLKPAKQKKASIVTASPFFYAYVFAAMAKSGLRQEVIDIISEKWGHWLDQGAVSCWETFEPTSLSKCHAWSASPLYFFMNHILGVTSAAPGYTKARIAPLPGKLEFARGTVPTPHGALKIEWERAGEDQLAVRLEIPESMEVEFVSPAGQSRMLRGGTHEFQT